MNELLSDMSQESRVTKEPTRWFAFHACFVVSVFLRLFPACSGAPIEWFPAKLSRLVFVLFKCRVSLSACAEFVSLSTCVRHAKTVSLFVD